MCKNKEAKMLSIRNNARMVYNMNHHLHLLQNEYEVNIYRNSKRLQTS